MNLKERLLVVDDQTMIRSWLKTSLKKIGFEDIDDASNGKIALDMLVKSFDEGKPYGLVFIDFMMPEMSGIDVVRACRNDPKLKNLKFIMISAEQSKELIVEAASLSVKAYIVKPFVLATLTEKINLVLG